MATPTAIPATVSAVLVLRFLRLLTAISTEDNLRPPAMQARE